MKEAKRFLKIILNIIIPVVGIILVCTVGPWLLRFFMPFVIGWFIAMIANPLVRFLERKLKLVRKHSSVLIVVVVLAAVIGILYLLISRIVIGISVLIRDLPQNYELVRMEVQQVFANLDHIFEKLPLETREAVLRFNDNLGSYIGELVQKIAFPTVTVAGNVAKGIPAALVYSIVVILSSYFFIAERERIFLLGKRVIPKEVIKYYDFFLQEIKRLIGGYFLAQFRIMFVVAAILAVGFLILNVQHGLLLAVLIAMLDFLPLFGTGTALFPWALVKFLSGEYAFAVGLVLLYILTQVVRQIIQPKIVGDSMGISPLMTLLFLYLGFKIRGISGMILAVPIGMIVMSLYKYGAFDSLIENAKLLVREIQEFRRKD